MKAYMNGVVVRDVHIAGGTAGYACDRIELDAKDAKWLADMAKKDPFYAAKHLAQLAARFKENRAPLPFSELREDFLAFAKAAGIKLEPWQERVITNIMQNGNSPHRRIAENWTRRNANINAPYGTDVYAAVAERLRQEREFDHLTSNADCCGGGTYNGHAPWCKKHGAKAESRRNEEEAYRNAYGSERVAENARMAAANSSVIAAAFSEMPRFVAISVCAAAFLAAVYTIFF